MSRSDGAHPVNFSKREIIDISPTISEQSGVFPGDVKFRRNKSLDFANDHHLRLSSIETTLHLGAHADAPNHYDRDGCAIDEVDLHRYLGECLVVHATLSRAERVCKAHINPKFYAWPTSRILVRTMSFPDPDRWNSDFCSFDPALIEEWARAGVELIGIDTPSVDPETSKELEAHKMVARHNLSILEGLVLTDVPEGPYTLVALPLKIAGADASPVRAILLKA